MRVSLHAIERYRLHFPDAQNRDLENAVSLGMEVSPEFAAAINQRRNVDRISRYIVAPNNTGMFVISSEAVVITYLRFSQSQMEIMQPSLKKVPEPIPPAPKPVNPMSLRKMRAEIRISRKERRQQEWREAMAKKRQEEYQENLTRRYQSLVDSLPTFKENE